MILQPVFEIMYHTICEAGKLGVEMIIFAASIMKEAVIKTQRGVIFLII